jgi:ABC-type nitrate/sulfonate/bicarbonate transport system ATPase subunit
VARGIIKAYGGNQVLRGADLACKRRERLCLLGHSGSGKTTLLRVLAGLEQPDAGEVLVNGRGLNSYDRRTWPIAMVFQKPAVYPHLSVAENIAFPLRARGTRAAEVMTRVNAVAQMVGVGHLLHRTGRYLSGGEAQRVALGKSVAVAPPVLLLDEPLSSVDVAHKWDLLRVLKRIHDAEATAMVLVTHDAAEGRFFADQIAILIDGKCSVPIPSGADPLTCGLLSGVRAMAQPPANELQLTLLRRNAKGAMYGDPAVRCRIVLPPDATANEIILLWLPHDGIIRSSDDSSDPFLAVMSVEGLRPVGWSHGGALVEVTGSSAPGMFLALADGAAQVGADQALWVRRDRLGIYDPSTSIRLADWTLCDARDMTDG